jgi:hypothetical protein
VGPWESKKVDYGFWYSFWIPSVRRNIEFDIQHNVRREEVAAFLIKEIINPGHLFV